MIEKFLMLFVLASCACFSMSQTVIENLAMCTEQESQSQWTKSIDFLTLLASDEKTPDLDKVHYLQRLRLIHQIAHDVRSYIDYSNKIQDLCDKSPECKNEFISHYGDILTN